MLTYSAIKWLINQKIPDTFWDVMILSSFFFNVVRVHTHLKDFSVTSLASSLKLKRDQNKALFETRTKVISYYNTAISWEWESARFTEAPKRQKSKELQFLLIIFVSVTHVYIPLSSRQDFYTSRITRACTKPVFMPLSTKYIWRCHPGLKNDRNAWLLLSK